jgi:hypothetical protein
VCQDPPMSIVMMRHARDGTVHASDQGAISLSRSQHDDRQPVSDQSIEACRVEQLLYRERVLTEVKTSSSRWRRAWGGTCQRKIAREEKE